MADTEAHLAITNCLHRFVGICQSRCKPRNRKDNGYPRGHRFLSALA
jgi:hypothetical protein